jgi:hypothetical protein
MWSALLIPFLQAGLTHAALIARNNTNSSTVPTASTYAPSNEGPDLDWIQTTGLPTQTTELLSTNSEAIMPTATGPVGGMGSSPINFTKYSTDTLENFWNTWVGGSAVAR